MIAPVHFTETRDVLHQRFAELLPRIEAHAKIYFRFIPCHDRRRDHVAEVVAIAFKWYRRLAERGIDAMQFPSAIAGYAARAVASGRRAVGIERAKDVMSRRCQRRHGFTVEQLPISTATNHEQLYGTPRGQRQLDEWEERLTDNRRTSPAEQAMFRIDFRAWLRSLSRRERKIVKAMIRSERTKDLARRFNVTAGRVSQMRAKFKEDWRRFTGDVDELVTA